MILDLLRPDYLERRSIRRSLEAAAPLARGDRLLDIGCATKPYRDLFQVACYVGLEHPTGGATQATCTPTYGEVTKLESRGGMAALWD